MIEVKVKLEVITPMFMRGYAGVELRPASFKGLMRWWWRAVKSDTDIKRLHGEEAKIFGYSDMGASKVQINVEGGEVSSSTVNLTVSGPGNVWNYKWRIDGEVITWSSEKKKMKEYNKRSGKREFKGHYPGLSYLLYPFLMLGLNKNNHRKILYHFSPGYTFTLTLRSLYREPLRQALASLWCAVWLGGFGARSRRGGGNLAFADVNIPDGLNLNLAFKFEGGNFFNWLKENFQKCREIIGPPQNFTDRYSNLALARVMVSEREFSTWYGALNSVGRIFYDFRRNTDHRENFVFGLPHKYNKCQGKETFKKYKRRASPVVIKVVKVGYGYRWLVLRLQGRFLPNCPWVDYRAIDRFWEELEGGGGKELLLGTPGILDRYVENLRREGAKRIVLFGSKARGDFTRKSDTDLYVEPAKYYEAVGNLDVVTRPSEALRKPIEREGVEIWRSGT